MSHTVVEVLKKQKSNARRDQKAVLMMKLMSTGAVHALVCSYADDAGTGREWLQCRCSRWIHKASYGNYEPAV